MDIRIKILNKLKLIMGSNNVYAIKNILNRAVLVDTNDIGVRDSVFKNLFIVETNKLDCFTKCGNIVYIDNVGKYRVVAEKIRIDDELYVNNLDLGAGLAGLDTNSYGIGMLSIVNGGGKATIVIQDGRAIDVDAQNTKSLIHKISLDKKCEDIQVDNYVNNVSKGTCSFENGKYKYKMKRISMVVDKSVYRNIIDYMENKIGYYSGYTEYVYGDLKNNKVVSIGEYLGEGYRLSALEDKAIGNTAAEESDKQTIDKFGIHEYKYIKSNETRLINDWSINEYKFESVVVCHRERCSSFVPEEYREMYIEVKDNAEFEIIELENDVSDDDIVYTLKGDSLKEILPEHGVYKVYKNRSKDCKVFEYNYSGVFLNILSCARAQMEHYWRNYDIKKWFTHIKVEVVYRGGVYRVQDREVHMLVKGNKVKLMLGCLSMVRRYTEACIMTANNKYKLEHLLLDNRDFEEYGKQENIQ